MPVANRQIFHLSILSPLLLLRPLISSGPIGICLINVISLLLTIVTIALYAAIFTGWLSKNVLTQVERDKLWLSGGDATSLQWSFWLLPAAGAAQLLALIFVAVAAKDEGAGDHARRCCCFKNDENPDVNMHDVMIY